MPHSTPFGDGEAERPVAGHEASRARQHAATSERQYLADHIRFITHQGKQILQLDLANCSAAEAERIFRATPEVVTTRPRGSVLILCDFRGASANQETIRVMKETAVFDKPYVKKCAWFGVESLPQWLCEDLSTFSRREFRIFETRKAALEWLAKD
ncbi:MAG: hypothetical protein ACYDDS_20995 [Candidatus Sulfotelmatobacter sp.]